MNPDHEITELLRRVAGLDAAALGTSTVERAIRSRLKNRGLALGEYSAALPLDREEQQALIEAVVVPETWFYRGREAFATFSQLAARQWLSAPGRAPLRLLSVPCSTGEEPYSMAMAMLEAGLPAGQFQIDAVDISAQALAQAKRAVYGRNSFRGKDVAFRDRHFRPTADGYSLDATVRQGITFRAGNLLDADFMAGAQAYDFIFCRNLLIYFDRPAQQRALRALHGLLRADGVLFVGHAESGLLTDTGFISARHAMSFSFAKAGAARETKKLSAPPQFTPPRVRRSGGNTAFMRKPRPAPAPAPVAASTPPPAPPAPAAKPSGDLEAARRLADEGRLESAAAMCETLLRRGRPSAALYCLLGVVRDAAGDVAQAGDCYRKAIYLEPENEEALMHLALLAERRGDDADARQLRRRARRAQEKCKAA